MKLLDMLVGFLRTGRQDSALPEQQTVARIRQAHCAKDEGGVSVDTQVRDLISHVQAEREVWRAKAALSAVPDQLAAFLQVHDLVDARVSAYLSNGRQGTPEDAMLCEAVQIVRATTTVGYSDKTPKELVQSALTAFSELAETGAAVPWINIASKQVSIAFNKLNAKAQFEPNTGAKVCSPLLSDYTDSFFYSSMALDAALKGTLGAAQHAGRWDQRPQTTLPASAKVFVPA